MQVKTWAWTFETQAWPRYFNDFTGLRPIAGLDGPLSVGPEHTSPIHYQICRLGLVSCCHTPEDEFFTSTRC